MDLFERDWSRRGSAPESEIDHLVSVSPVELPAAYLSLLRVSNGGEGPLAVQPYLVILDNAERVANAIAGADHQEFFPGFVMIGSNGGGEYIALDTRKAAPWPVVAIDMVNIDLDESVLHIAASFDAFLDLLGIETPDTERRPEADCS
jgi:SMI1 / KNR4 family (SUKH-1)